MDGRPDIRPKTENNSAPFFGQKLPFAHLSVDPMALTFDMRGAWLAGRPSFRWKG
jgi:hypothetical protein